MLGLFLVALATSAVSPLSPDFSFSEFSETPFFTALEIFFLSVASRLILQIIGHMNTFRPTPITKKNTGAFLRAKHWLKWVNRFSPPAVDVRRSWTLQRADEPFQNDSVMPSNPMLMMLPTLAGIGPSIVANWMLSDRPALRLPFNIPGPLQRLFQYGLPPRFADDHRIVGAFGMYFAMNFCSALLAGIFPIHQKRKPLFGPKDNYRNFSDLLISEQPGWELDRAEEELLAIIDAAGC
jgi:hypothetical protein